MPFNSLLSFHHRCAALAAPRKTNSSPRKVLAQRLSQGLSYPSFQGQLDMCEREHLSKTTCFNSHTSYGGAWGKCCEAIHCSSSSMRVRDYNYISPSKKRLVICHLDIYPCLESFLEKQLLLGIFFET